MRNLAESIFQIVHDYHCDHDGCKYPMSVDHIMNWANQFGEDGEFVLQELQHFLPNVYLSKPNARIFLKQSVTEFSKFYGYPTEEEFLRSTSFLDLQRPFKSQKEILSLLNLVIVEDFNIDPESLMSFPKKHFIYFDDILASGGTLFRDLSKWLNENTSKGKNFDLVISKDHTLASSYFCIHELGLGNVKWRLMKAFDDKIRNLLLTRYDYLIENQAKWSNQKLNCMYPTNNQSAEAIEFLEAISSEYVTGPPAFREINKPVREAFFTNRENRNKLERLFIDKGLDLLGRIRSQNPDPRKRPLGDTVRSHKTFGTGTLYFTWRNISNTCPLVFWWDVPSHNWIPLFCLKNRGLSQ